MISKLGKFFSSALTVLTVVLVSGLLSGCDPFSEPCEVIKKYTLDPLAGDARRGSKSARHVVVETPLIYPPLDSSRIALKPEKQTIDYFAGAEWGDRLALLIQESVIYSLQKLTHFPICIPPRGRPDYGLYDQTGCARLSRQL